MKVQIKPPTGECFWDFTNITLERSELSGGKWVKWDRKEWYCKIKEPCTLCEVVGYQIAESIDLPLQPWLAFFRKEKKSKCGWPFSVGILVERWGPATGQCDLADPAKTHPDLVARALALGVFDRFEWPQWLFDDDKTQLRLFDLERIGDVICWPPQRTSLSAYRSCTQEVLSYAREKALAAGLGDLFEQSLLKLREADFAHILDLSGCPFFRAIERVVIRSLGARQWEARRLLDGVNRVPIPRKKGFKPRNAPRQMEKISFGFDHPDKGFLQGDIWVKPKPRGYWSVSWDIGAMDRDSFLSDKWFSRDVYQVEFMKILKETDRQAELLGYDTDYDGVSPRWGEVIKLPEEVALFLAKKLYRFWQKIVSEWRIENEKRKSSAI